MGVVRHNGTSRECLVPISTYLTAHPIQSLLRSLRFGHDVLSPLPEIVQILLSRSDLLHTCSDVLFVASEAIECCDNVTESAA